MNRHHPAFPKYREEYACIKCFAKAMAIVAAASLVLLAYDLMANRADDAARIREAAAETARIREAAAETARQIEDAARP